MKCRSLIRLGIAMRPSTHDFSTSASARALFTACTISPTAEWFAPLAWLRGVIPTPSIRAKPLVFGMAARTTQYWLRCSRGSDHVLRMVPWLEPNTQAHSLQGCNGVHNSDKGSQSLPSVTWVKSSVDSESLLCPLTEHAVTPVHSSLCTLHTAACFVGDAGKSMQTSTLWDTIRFSTASLTRWTCKQSQ
jgi:hypothetical protein